MKALFLALPLLLGNGGPDAQNYCQSTSNSAGVNAVISWGVSVTNDYQVIVNDMVPSTYCHMTIGSVPMNTPMGNGWLCIHPAYSQFLDTPQVSSQAGNRTWSTDLAYVAPGETVYFQAWYRDPGFGMNFNTSDGLQVTK